MSDCSVDRLGGRYRLGPLLGRGGMSDVYRADDELLGRAVAVKVFGRDAEMADVGIRQRTEVQLLASLAHPGLVTVFDAGVDATHAAGPRSYLVLELVDGTALGARLTLGPLPPAEVRSVGCQVAAALAYVHGRGIVHRDVKPANILLSSEDTGEVVAKLADFGIARLVDSAHITTAGTTVGTANYLSPEQVRGDDIGPPSDVYSLGLVLLECLTGTRAYPGLGVEAAIARLHRAPAIPVRLGPAWVRLLGAMTAADPARRPSATEVLHLLRQLSEQRSGEAAARVDNGDVPTDQLGPFPGLLWHDAPQAGVGPKVGAGRRRPARPVALAGVVSAAALVVFGYLGLGSLVTPSRSATPDRTTTSVPVRPQSPAALRTPAAAGPGTPEATAAPRPSAPAAVQQIRRAVVPLAPTAKTAKPAKQHRHGSEGGGG